MNSKLLLRQGINESKSHVHKCPSYNSIVWKAGQTKIYLQKFMGISSIWNNQHIYIKVSARKVYNLKSSVSLVHVIMIYSSVTLDSKVWEWCLAVFVSNITDFFYSSYHLSVDWYRRSTWKILPSALKTWSA